MAANSRRTPHCGLARWLVAVHRMPAAGGGGGGFGGLGGGGLGGRGGKMATRKVKCVLVVVISVLFCTSIFLGLRVSAGVPGKLQPPQPRQRLRQTIRDHGSTLGRHKSCQQGNEK